MNRVVFDLQRFLNVTVAASNTLVSGTADDDKIELGKYGVTVSNVTVDAGAGDDSITHSFYDIQNTVIYAGDGNDFITNGRGSNVTINAGAGNDYIRLYHNSSNVTLSSGEGNDTIHLETLAQGTTITDFDVSDKLRLDERPTFAKFANNVLNLDGLKINLPNITNIDDYRDMVVSCYSWNQNGDQVIYETTLGELLDVPAPYWKLSGTTATYYAGDGSVILTLTGLKSGLKVSNGEIAGIDVNFDHSVTLSKDVLDKKIVSLNIQKAGENNGLDVSGFNGLDVSGLKDTVPVAAFEDIGWTILGTTATYKTKCTATGYYLVKNKVKYSTKGAVHTAATITGIKSGTKVNEDGSITGIDVFYDDYNGNVWRNMSFTDSAPISDKITFDGDEITFDFSGGYDDEGTWVTSHFDNRTISGGANDDYIEFYGDNNIIKTDAGDDFISSNGGGSKNNTLVSGDGNDTIWVQYGSEDTTVNSGKGNDFIAINVDYEGFSQPYLDDGVSAVIQYYSGDGDDVVVGFSDNDTLQIAGSYTTFQDSDCLIVNVGSGSITLLDFVGKANIEAVKGGASDIVWTISGTTATGKVDGKQVAKITGLKKGTKASALSGYGYEIVIPQSALTTSTVKITSDEYQLKLGDDVTVSDVTEAGWTIDGTKATYKTENSTLGYYLASDGKSITYKKAVVGKTLATIEDLSSKVTASDLTINTAKKTVTVNSNALGTGTATISGGYNLVLGDDVTKSTTTKASWTIDDDVAEYTTTKVTKGYVLASNKKSITYNKASGGEMVATVSGLKKGAKAANLVVKNNVIYVANAALSKDNIVTLDSEDYTLAVGSGAKKSVTSPEGWYISGTTASYNAEKTAVGYAVFDDGKSIEYISEVDGGDTFVKLTGLKNRIKAKDLSIDTDTNVVTISDENIGKPKSGVGVIGEGYEFKLSGAGKMTNKGKNATLTGSSGDDTLIGSKYADTIKGGDGKDYISGGNDTLIGGIGNDSLYSTAGKNVLSGGSSADEFYFTKGDATITDYTEGSDKIYLKGNTVTKTEVSGRNVIFTTSTGTLTVKNGKGKNITVNDSTQKYSASSALFAEDNFMTADNLSAIVESNLSAVSEIETQNFDGLTKENLITYATK